MIRNDIMNKWVVLFSSLAVSSNVCAVDVKPYIVNGSYADVTTFPSMASLFFDQIDYTQVYGIASYCGASLLSNQYVLTAAHCIYGNEKAQLFTSVVPQLQDERDFPNNILEKGKVAAIYYPSTYNNTTLLDDIAILKLETPLTTVSSVNYLKRPDAGADATYRLSSEQFVAVGHGDTSSNVDNNTLLLQTNLTFVPNNLCNYESTTATNLCMQGVISGLTGLENATCQGDSGGPLFWSHGSEYIQVGLTSFGPATRCGDPSSSIGATSVFTEIHDYADWIDSVMNGSESPKFVVTEAKRQAYLNPPSSDSGGGSLGWWSLLLVFSTLLRRRWF
ncbi:S1 family peptidase [Vibrio aestuarianus]|uniref:Trypsin-like serine protease n=1 Tax=Vibrio aestuarianus TaxID=28171 RepID=A0A9X4FH66_9VIBR|nr:trypsin-like serine protease [Vibrio aestuarianus]MDE1236820.1 trypsin-like serine protease [Vibrio aestuarianus]MDE1247681.1 trypsin-like serine protease [Vibrio aestuarianus]MDE1348111.1 trypsin-like serine protease [Vibrio aestuarianus]NGZ64866.1 trypsin-like serine protease [Vibrio aestuarianus subsp. cardii]